MDRKYLEKQFSIGPKIVIIFSFKIRAQRRGKLKENKSTKGVGNWHAQLKKEEKWKYFGDEHHIKGLKNKQD